MEEEWSCMTTAAALSKHVTFGWNTVNALRPVHSDIDPTGLADTSGRQPE